MSENPIKTSIVESAQVIASLEGQMDQIGQASAVVVDTLRRGNKIMTAGHGGSAAEALHMSEELMGRFDKNRRPLPAVALAADPTLLTCIGNDFGFDTIFPRQVEGLCQSGDLLVIFSTSGNGVGFLRSVDAAHAAGGQVLSLLGKGGGELSGHADYELVVESNVTARVQEAHQLVMHILLESVDREFA